MANLKTLLNRLRTNWSSESSPPAAPLNSASVVFKLLVSMTADTSIVGLGTESEVFLQDGVQLFIAKMPTMSESWEAPRELS